MSMLVSPGRCAIGAALVLTSPFVPLLFQGEEWGARTPFLYFTDHHDPELASAVSAGRRREFADFGWRPEDVPDPQAPATYARSKLDRSERERAPHADLLAWHRALIRLRGEHPALADGRVDAVRVRLDESVPWLVVERGPVTVACNLSREAAVIPLGEGRPTTVLLSSQPASYVSGGALHVAPESVLIVG
jgi:maltooligosyltrehalose trehalohydrolase